MNLGHTSIQTIAASEPIEKMTRESQAVEETSRKGFLSFKKARKELFFLLFSRLLFLEMMPVTTTIQKYSHYCCCCSVA